ncbi:uncharacterized protein LOC135844117 [Planococcus citri]|uniref:uncharacterized protein LOC135844117 n=1 Tax=Planococcus citri TaxID=170843 RepID=UPI0031F81388
MFYEIKDKRVESGTQTRWWLTAAFCGVVITAGFIGIIFWLGISVRQPDPPNYERRPSSLREYQQRGKISKPPAPTQAPATPPPYQPQIEYPTAEILKTTIKHKKGRIEMVDNGASSANAKSNSSRDTDEYAENDSPDAQLRSKIAKLSSIQEYEDGDGDGESDHEIRLKGGISPLEEIPPMNTGAAVSSDHHSNSVKKKSEAVLPSWYDPNLHVVDSSSLSSSSSSKMEPLNDLKQADTVYDLPDFSVIKPDLSAFNTKTIPAFTYLKEPLPQFENVPATSSDMGNVDDSLYYHDHDRDHHHHHPPHHHHHHGQPNRHQQSSPSSSNSALGADVNENIVSGSATTGAAKDDNSLMNFLQKRLQSMHDWLLYGSKRNRSVDVMEIVKMVNNSLQTKNVGAIFSKFKDLYVGLNTSDVQNMPVANLLYPTSPSLLNNSTSLVSFGLLAIDLFLLHNVQQIVWNEESKIGEEMLKDPDVVALNALFMSPDRVQQLRQTNSRKILTDDEGDSGKQQKKGKGGVVHDLLEFINGGLRAVLNLSRAYKSSVGGGSGKSNNARSTSNGSTLDCIWTLYCRNLDKTAKLQGPYGFLAKMNSLGLRLMMGEFPAEKALDRLMKEYNSGWGPLDCDKLFPRCNAEEAKEIVIQTALGRSTI